MKHFILVGFLLAIFNSVWSQDKTCGYDPRNRNKELDELKLRLFDHLGRAQERLESDPVNIPLQIHIIKNSANEVPLLADIQRNIVELNKAFAPVNIQFYQCNNVHYIVSDAYDTWDFLTSIGVPQEYNNPFALDIFYVKTLPGACGVFSGFVVNQDQYIAIQNTCSEPGVLIHEIGHYFGLDHTHDSYWGKETVNKSNCQTAGDRFCDTPADPNLQGKTGLNCAYTGTDKDPNGQSYQPSTKNFMSYANQSCLNEFSPEQYAFMRRYFDSYLKTTYPYSCGPKPDLAGQLFSSIKSLKKGAVNEIGFTVNNYSTYTIPQGNVDYALSLVSQFGDSSVIYTGKFIKAWGQYQKDSVKVQVPVPAIPDGSYRLVLTLDTKNAVNEILETNNTSSVRVGVYVNASMPDLHLTTEKSKANAGLEYVHTYMVKNEGQIDSDQFSIMFAVSSDTKLSQDDIFTGPFFFPTMQKGDSAGGTQSIIFPNDPGKRYYLITVVDIANSITESDENNNIVVDTISLFQYNNPQKPDYTIKNWDFLEPAGSTYMQDQFFTITARIENIGGGSTFLVPVATYISTDAVWDAQDKLTWFDSDRMYNNASNSAWLRVTIPANYPVGNAYILMVLDHKNAVAESNENNNVTAVPIKVIANTQADMTPQTVSISDYELELEEPFTVNGTFKNLGFSTTSYWYVTVYINDTANYLPNLKANKYVGREYYYNSVTPNQSSSKSFFPAVPKGEPYNIQAGVYWMDICSSNTRTVGFSKDRCITLPKPVVIKEKQVLTGLETITENTIIKVYPNPSEDYVIVESNLQAIEAVSIFSMEGSWIKTAKTGSANQVEIKTNDLSIGAYMMHIKSANGTTVTRKLMVIR